MRKAISTILLYVFTMTATMPAVAQTNIAAGTITAKTINNTRNALKYSTFAAAYTDTPAGGYLEIPSNYTGQAIDIPANKAINIECANADSSVLTGLAGHTMFIGSGVVKFWHIKNCNINVNGGDHFLTMPSFGGGNDWSSSDIKIDDNTIHDSTSWAITVGQSGYFGHADNNIFYNVNGGIDALWASDWKIDFNSFGCRTPGTHNNPYIRTRGGSRFYISFNDLENDCGDMGTTPDIYLDACGASGTSGWTYVLFNKDGPEGEPVGGTRPKVQMASSCAPTTYQFERAMIFGNQFGGDGQGVGYALQIDATPSYCMFEGNFVNGMHTVINDNSALVANSSSGFCRYGENNQVATPVTGLTSDNTVQTFVHGGRFFQQPKDDPHVGDVTMDPIVPQRETTLLNNRIPNSTFAGISGPFASGWNGSNITYSNTISSISRSGTTVSVVTAACTSVTNAFWVSISGVTDAANFPPGNKLVTSAADCNHFTYTEAGAAVSSSAGSVIAYLLKMTGGQADPDGGTNAVLVTRAGRTAFENIQIAIDLTALPSYLFSRVCVKQGSLSQAQWGVLRTDDQNFQGAFPILTAHPDWSCKYVQDERGLDTTKTFSWTLYPGDGEANARSGSIYVYAPQVSDSYGADYEPTSSVAVTHNYGARFNRLVEFGNLVGAQPPFTVASSVNVPGLNASSLNGATFPSPGAIGGTTPGTASFTTLALSGASSGTGIQGTDTKLMTAGTVSGTAAPLCTTANGGATTSGCPSVLTIQAKADRLAQTAAIGSTTLLTPGADGAYQVNAALSCDSVSAAATVSVTIGWTDTSNTAQSVTSSNAACTALGAGSFISLAPQSINVKSGTNVTYSTTIANTPTYDLRIAVMGPW